MTRGGGNTYRFPTMRLPIIVCALALILSGCASSSGSYANGRRASADPVILRSGTPNLGGANANLRQPRGLRGLRGLRGPRQANANRFASNRTYRSYGNDGAFYNWEKNQGGVRLGNFGFQKSDRSFWIGPAQAPGLGVPHTVGPSRRTGQAQQSQGGVTYDPIRRRFVYQ